MEQFLRVKKVFESLSQLGSSSHRDLFNTRLTQLSPILRYCEYNLKRAEGENAAALLDLLSSADNSQLSQQLADLIQNELVESSEELRVVSFRGLFLPVETEELRKAFQEVRAAGEVLSRELTGQVEGDTLLVTLTAECREQIGQFVEIPKE